MNLRLQSKRVAVATLFGAVMFTTATILPSPIDKMFIIVHALPLALGALLLRRFGATYVAIVGGVLTALWRTALAPFSFVFALLYGLLVDGFFFIFNVYVDDGTVKTGRMMASMTISTALVGVLSYYVTVLSLNLLQRNFALEVAILVAGTLNGIVAGYLTSIIWNKHLKNARL